MSFAVLSFAIAYQYISLRSIDSKVGGFVKTLKMTNEGDTPPPCAPVIAFENHRFGGRPPMRLGRSNPKSK